MDIDRVKRYLASEVAGHHDHARHPKENDVKAGNQHGGGQEMLELQGFFIPAQRTKSY